MNSNYMDNISFQYFPAKIWDASPIGSLTLREFLEAHKNPKPSTVEVITKIREAASTGDLKLKDSLKQNNLYSFVPSVKLDGDGRGLINIIDYNPIMLVEFDKIDHAKELKERLFNNLKSVIAAWVSPSGRGTKLLVRIPKPKSVDEYKEYYCGLAFYLSQYEGFDPVNTNAVLPLFLSYDLDILIREDAEEWVQRGGKINSFKPYMGEVNIPSSISDENRQKITDKITFLVNLIEDNGHLKLRAYSTLLGGYCAQYGLSTEDADDLIHGLIDNNNYLKKNLRGYKKTASEMIRKGMSSPIELN